MNCRIKSSILEKKIYIEPELIYENNLMDMQVYELNKYIVDTTDILIREALIKLGRTPPKE